MIYPEFLILFLDLSSSLAENVRRLNRLSSAGSDELFVRALIRANNAKFSLSSRERESPSKHTTYLSKLQEEEGH